MGSVKKYSIGFAVNILVAIMAIVSFIVYILNVSTAYYEDMNTSVVTLMICAIALIVTALILPGVSGGKLIDLIVDVFRVGAAVLIIVAGVTFIGMRVESFGYIFGSNLELGNDAAFQAGSQAITGIVLFVVTWFLALIASFFDIVKKK